MENFNPGPRNKTEEENNLINEHNSFFSKDNLYKVLGTTLTIGGVSLVGAAGYELFTNEDASQLIQRNIENIPDILRNALNSFDQISVTSKALLGVFASSFGRIALSKIKETNSNE